MKAIRSVIFGDSLTAGTNVGGLSYIHCFDKNVLNLAVDGTTIGEYSLYPVDGQSGLSMVSRYADLIKQANVVYVAYASNDISAIAAHNVNTFQVRNAIAKIYDLLKQLNNKLEVLFILPAYSHKEDVIKEMAKNNARYLKGYLRLDEVETTVLESSWGVAYRNIARYLEENYKVFDLFKDKQAYVNHLSEDGLHPDALGHTIMGLHLIRQFS